MVLRTVDKVYWGLFLWDCTKDIHHFPNTKTMLLCNYFNDLYIIITPKMGVGFTWNVFPSEIASKVHN